MSDPATRQIQNALLTLCTSAIPGTNFFIDRSAENGLSEEEIPGVIIRIIDVSKAQIEYDQWRWQCTVQFDCYSGIDASLSIDAVNQRIISDIMAAVFDDRTLGGKVESIEPDFADASEKSQPDVGWAVLQFTCFFVTQPGDFTALI